MRTFERMPSPTDRVSRNPEALWRNIPDRQDGHVQVYSGDLDFSFEDPVLGIEAIAPCLDFSVGIAVPG